MKELNTDFVERHENYYEKERTAQNSNRILTPGSQYLVQLLQDYLPDCADGAGRRALDIGCGSGFNLVSLAKMNWDVYGCEISEKIIEHTRNTVAEYGVNPTLKIGNNCKIPYPDNFFHLLISINTIHYLTDTESYFKALTEFRRVLAPNGRIVLMTIAPGNWLLKGAKEVSPRIWKVAITSDYRYGNLLYVFPSKKELIKFYSHFFEDLIVGKNRVDFFSRVLYHYVVTGIKTTK